jgi:hypothetical protein
VQIDRDGCCKDCGLDATGNGVDAAVATRSEHNEALAEVEQLRTELEETRAEVVRLKKINTAIYQPAISGYCCGYEAGHYDTVEGVFCGDGNSDSHIELAEEWLDNWLRDNGLEMSADKIVEVEQLRAKLAALQTRIDGAEVWWAREVYGVYKNIHPYEHWIDEKIKMKGGEKFPVRILRDEESEG